MAAGMSSAGSDSGRFRLPLALRLALRDLRGGFAGFTIFLICIALGTGAIGAINGLSDAIQDSLAREGSTLLGGDIEATLVHRQANADELAYLKTFGEVSEVATLRAMARKPDGSGQAFVDLKAVDGAYPLYGVVALEEGRLSSLRDGGVAVDGSILDQMQLRVGDSIAIGVASFPITAIIEQEPDRIAAGPAFGARIMLSLDALKKTELVEPGSLAAGPTASRRQPALRRASRKTSPRNFPRLALLYATAPTRRPACGARWSG